MLAGKDAVLSVAVPKAADPPKVVRVARVVKAHRAKVVIKAAKSIMGNLLLLVPALKTQGMALNELLQRAENPSIKALESPVIRAKASDFYWFLSKSAIILVLQLIAAAFSGSRLMLRST